MEPRKTILYDRHVSAGAKMVDFAGWSMPMQYKPGIVAEHLTTRKTAGLFDVSHMGRFAVSGSAAVDFLQHVLTNDASRLEARMSQYTIIPDADGYAIDDAYLYRFSEGREYMLVVNASNAAKDLEHLQKQQAGFADVQIEDISDSYAMISLQGPESENIITPLIDSGLLPVQKRNSLSTVEIFEAEVFLARTGYTGEPVCLELMIPADRAVSIWDALVENGASPTGLGARDTLRLEASLPLYGHEFGTDPGGNKIPIFACGLAGFAVSFAEAKGDFIGRGALRAQYEASKKIAAGDCSDIESLPQRIRPIVLKGRGIARPGDKIFCKGEESGFVTSGTMIPCWKTDTAGQTPILSDQSAMRSVALGIFDSRIPFDAEIEIEIRGRKVAAMVVKRNLLNNKGKIAFAVEHIK